MSWTSHLGEISMLGRSTSWFGGTSGKAEQGGIKKTYEQIDWCFRAQVGNRPECAVECSIWAELAAGCVMSTFTKHSSVQLSMAYDLHCRV